MLLHFKGIVAGKGHASKPEARQAFMVREFIQTLYPYTRLEE